MIIYFFRGEIAMGKSIVSIVAALDSKRGIGKNNNLLFRIPEDFDRMKKLTLGHPLIMGRKTFESIGHVLPGRTNIVITKNKDFNLAFQGQALEGYVVNSLEKGIETARNAPGSEEIFIFGGGQIFKEALEKDLVDHLYLTIVEARLDSPPDSPARRGDLEADTFFPDYSGFSEVAREDKSDENYKYSFLTLKR